MTVLQRLEDDTKPSDIDDSKTCRPRVLLIGEIEYAIDEWRKIEEACEIVHFPHGTRSDFLRLARKGAFEGCMVICRSNQYTHLTGPCDAALLDVMPKTVRYICNIGSGVDAIDRPECKARGIQVSNTPSLAADGVAETVLFLIYGVLRRAAIPLTTARQGQWQSNCPTGSGMSNKTLGLIGSGAIATAVAFRAQAFDMKVQFCSHHNKAPVTSIGKVATQVTFDQLIRTSDIISLHVPLTPTTRAMLGADEFAAMKPGSVIVNTARGGVIDLPALLGAVRSGKVWGAGLDVYDEEPHIPSEMREDERFFLLPHIATKTHEIRKAMEETMMENLERAILGRELVSPV